ncbi:MAG: hypothetical protein JNM00_12315 [Flavobacteriales bacterium]|nr:hypothetical protein [Flavobacteriales bacterium]
MKIRFPLFALLAALSMMFVTVACGDKAPATTATETTTDTVITVNLANYVFDMSVPKDLVADNMISIVNNEQHGNLEINIGKSFGLLVSEGNALINNAIEQLEQETIFKNTIMEKDTAMVMYQRHLPDQQKYHVHFVQNVIVNNQQYCVRTRQDGLFNEQDADLMLKVARSLRTHQ